MADSSNTRLNAATKALALSTGSDRDCAIAMLAAADEVDGTKVVVPIGHVVGGVRCPTCGENVFVDFPFGSADFVERPAVERLVAALRPFADAAPTFDHCSDETLHIHPHVPLSDYRKARAALAEFGQQPTVTDAYLRNLKELGADDEVIDAANRAAKSIAAAAEQPTGDES